MTKIKKLYGLILAGGFSKRMGQDKALLNYHGKPQIEYVCDLLDQSCEQVFLSKRPEQKEYFLSPPKVSVGGPEDSKPLDARLKHSGMTNNSKIFGDDKIINDSPEFSNISGPLAGILSAMKLHPESSWLVMACDLPFVTQETLQYLIQNRDANKLATAFKSSSDGLPEPLCAIWEGHGYNQILDFAKKGIRCPRKILINSNTCLLNPPNPHWLDNVNSPEEFKQAKTLL